MLLLGVRAVHAIEMGAGGKVGMGALVVLLAAAGAVGYSFRSRPLRFGLALAAIMAAGATYAKGSTRLLYTARSFYGTHKVMLEPPTTRTLAHGNTTHGAQDLAPERRHEPLTYYHRTGPIGGVMAAWQGRPQRRRVGVVGLGAGSLAAYAAPGERWTFFEIDPAVIDTARDRGLFTFVGDARGAVDVVPGDARLSLAATPDATFGLLVLDAFSSDGVPAHLLTREAFALYLRKLAPGGVIAVHLSNRYLDLESVVAGERGRPRSIGPGSLRQSHRDRGARPGRRRRTGWCSPGRRRISRRSRPTPAGLHRAAPARAGPTTPPNLWGVLHLLGR